MRDPEAWQTVPDLTEEEQEALKNVSKVGFWKQPKQLRVTVIALCFAAIVQYVLQGLKPLPSSCVATIADLPRPMTA